MIPEVRAWHIDRPKVLDKLDTALKRRLGLVMAPAGYGKTTILAQWADRVMANGAVAAWLSLDVGDSEPAQFVAYIVWALEAAGVALGETLGMVGHAFGQVPPDSVLTSLLNELGRTRADTVLVLDDYHRAENKDVDQIVNSLIDRSPPHFHLILASREVPGIKLAELRASKDSVEIGAEDLRFTPNDAKSMYSHGQKSSVSTEQAVSLTEQTEGWVLALQLAGQFMENEGSGIDVIERFSGRTAEMADYLSEQILLGLPDEIQSFLMETSVLERFNGDIANAIRGKTDSWFMVEELERRNLFLFFLDSERKWFRYHHLFQEFLHERLRRLDTARLESLNRAAADWFVRNGQLSTAVHHAILANDLELAADLLEQAGGWRMVLTGQVGIIRSACDKIPKKNIRERPRLWLGEILLLAKTGTIVEARRKLDEFTASGFAAVQSDKPLYAEHQVVDIIVAGYEDRRVSAKDLSSLEESVADPEVLDNVVLALLYNYLCLVYLDFCRFDKSIEAGNRSINHFRAMGNDYAEKLVETHIGQAKLGQGRLINARDIYQRVYDSAQASFGFDDDAAAIAGTLLAETAYERNELAAAKELLDTTLPHVERFDGWFDIYAAGYLTASSVAHATDGIDAALTVLDRAEETARRRGLDRLVLLSRVHRARELTLAGRLDEAAAIVARNEAMRSRGSGFSSWRLWEAMGPMLARLALRRGDPGGALEILRPLEEEAAANGCEHQSIRLLALLALTNHEKGERKIALECLERAVLLAAPQGFVRPFVEEGEAMKQLFSNLLKAGPKLIPAVTSFVEAILNTEEAYGGALLSERESQILGMISSGHSTKEMAHLLALSENTVKYHRKRVYKKLGVASRSQAVATARRLLLLS